MSMLPSIQFTSFGMRSLITGQAGSSTSVTDCLLVPGLLNGCVRTCSTSMSRLIRESRPNFHRCLSRTTYLCISRRLRVARVASPTAVVSVRPGTYFLIERQPIGRTNQPRELCLPVSIIGLSFERRSIARRTPEALKGECWRVVSSEHAAYLADLSNALTQEPSTEFGPTPSGFIFTNPLGSERLGPAP